MELCISSIEWRKSIFFNLVFVDPWGHILMSWHKTHMTLFLQVLGSPSLFTLFNNVSMCQHILMVSISLFYGFKLLNQTKPAQNQHYLDRMSNKTQSHDIISPTHWSWFLFTYTQIHRFTKLTIEITKKKKKKRNCHLFSVFVYELASIHAYDRP